MGASSARQLKATRETNAQNYQIYQESKDFAREQADTQWQRELEMFDKENEYNNPVNVVGRLRDAGINPALAMQGSLGSSMSSAASGGSPAMGSSPTPPQMQVPDYYGYDQLLLNASTGVSDSMLKASEMLKNVASAKQTGIDTRYLEQTLNSRVQQAESESDYAKMQASLYKQFGFDRTVKELNKLDKECRSLDAQADNAILDGKYKEAQTSLTKLLQQKQIKDNEWYSLYIETKKKYVDRLVNAEVDKAETEPVVMRQQGSAAVTSAQAAYNSSVASLKNAATQEYLAHNPNDVGGLIAGVLKGFAGSPEDFGKMVKDEGLLKVLYKMTKGQQEQTLKTVSEILEVPYREMKRFWNSNDPVEGLLDWINADGQSAEDKLGFKAPGYHLSDWLRDRYKSWKYDE